MVQAPGPTGWEIFNTAIVTAATVAVAAFAWVELRRQNRESESRQKSIDARASADAYQLRRDLNAWIGSPPDLNILDQWLRANWNVHTKRSDEFERVKVDVRGLLGLAAEASPKVAGGIRRCAVHVLEGISRLERHCRQSEPPANTAAWLDWNHQRVAGSRDLTWAVAVLLSDVIEPELIQHEADAQMIRGAEIQLALPDPDAGPERHSQ